MPQVPFAAARRRFIQSLGLLAAAPLVGRSGLALAHSASGGSRTPGVHKTSPKPKVAAPPATPPTPPTPPEVVKQAQSLAEVVRTRYGAHLSDAQMTDVAKALENVVQNGDRLRKLKLQNGDEPDVTFRAALER